MVTNWQLQEKCHLRHKQVCHKTRAHCYSHCWHLIWKITNYKDITCNSYRWLQEI